MTMRRTRVESMPEAGKPEGLCPECGPHGNRGTVDLSVWRRHVVPCTLCDARADKAAIRRASELLADIRAEAEREGLEVDSPFITFTDDGTTWGRVARAEAKVARKSIEIAAARMTFTPGGTPVGVP